MLACRLPVTAVVSGQDDGECWRSCALLAKLLTDRFTYRRSPKHVDGRHARALREMRAAWSWLTHGSSQQLAMFDPERRGSCAPGVPLTTRPLRVTHSEHACRTLGNESSGLSQRRSLVRVGTHCCISRGDILNGSLYDRLKHVSGGHGAGQRPSVPRQLRSIIEAGPNANASTPRHQGRTSFHRPRP